MFKMSAFGTYACFESWMPLVNGCVNCALFNAVPNVYFITERKWVMQQIKYCTNIIMTSVSGRKDKQIKTHETDAAWHEAYYSC